MFLLFGLRTAVVLLGLPVYTCERCGNHAEHEVSRRVRKLTLFFVPVFPIGAARFTDSCTVCGRTLELSRAQAERAVTAPAAAPTDRPATSPGPQDAPRWTPQDR